MLINVMMIGGTNTTEGILSSFESAKLQGLFLNDILVDDIARALLNGLDELAAKSEAHMYTLSGKRGNINYYSFEGISSISASST